MGKDLKSFEKYLKTAYPLPKSAKIFIDYQPSATVKVLNPVDPALATGPGFYSPLVPSRKLDYNGVIRIATLADDALDTLAHEYQHARQFAENRWSADKYVEMEIEAMQFAKNTVREFQKAA